MGLPFRSSEAFGTQQAHSIYIWTACTKMPERATYCGIKTHICDLLSLTRVADHINEESMHAYSQRRRALSHVSGLFGRCKDNACVLHTMAPPLNLLCARSCVGLAVDAPAHHELFTTHMALRQDSGVTHDFKIEQRVATLATAVFVTRTQYMCCVRGNAPLN
jgi:hypothetical protein